MLDIQAVQDKKIGQVVGFPKQAQGFHGFYAVGATQWSVDGDGDIRDGELLIAEPSHLSRQGYKNAALIAAAPELLAALESLVKWRDPQNIPSHFLASYKKDVEIAREAIAKARGV